MASFKFQLRKDYKNKKGENPIRLRIHHQYKVATVNSGIYIKPKDWNHDQQRVRKSHPEYLRINDVLKSYEDRCEDAIRKIISEGKDPIPRAVKAAMENQQSRDLLAYFNEIIEGLSYWEQKKYLVTRGKLRAFRGDYIDFSEIDHAFLRRFQSFLQSEYNNSVNTIGKELARIRKIMRLAVSERIISYDQNPFNTGVEIKKEETKKVFLNEHELAELINADLMGNEKLVIARDYFLFAFYANGMRFGDVCSIRKRNLNGHHLTYTMNKHRGRESTRPVSLTLPDEAMQILGRYGVDDLDDQDFLFPALRDLSGLSFDNKKDGITLRNRISRINARINKRLYRIQKMLDWSKRLSMHVARHTVGYLARKHGVHPKDIQDMLNHSTIQVTDNYLGSLHSEEKHKRAHVFYEKINSHINSSEN